ncbi:AAEL011525-PA, partial [Aedes aegypti]
KSGKNKEKRTLKLRADSRWKVAKSLLIGEYELHLSKVYTYLCERVQPGKAESIPKVSDSAA